MTAQIMPSRVVISSLELKNSDRIKALSGSHAVNESAERGSRGTRVRRTSPLQEAVLRRRVLLASRELQMLTSEKLDPQFHKVNFVRRCFFLLSSQQPVGFS